MSNSFRVQARRFLPVAVGAIALTLSFMLLQQGLASKPQKIQNAVAQSPVRSDDLAASRGSARTPDSVVPTSVAPTTTSTTVLSTTTTAPKSTTTTAPPATVAAVAPAANGVNSQTGGASYYQQPASYAAGGCAHKTLPKGTVVAVTNLSNGRSTTCTVNDRGPYVSGRIIDLDTEVFQQVASTGSGVFNARISW